MTTSGATTTRTYYFAGGKRIAMGVNGTISYLAANGLNSTSVSLGASGSATASQLHAPYGAVRYASGTMPTDYGFTGQRADAADASTFDPGSGTSFGDASTMDPGFSADPGSGTVLGDASTMDPGFSADPGSGTVLGDASTMDPGTSPDAGGTSQPWGGEPFQSYGYEPGMAGAPQAEPSSSGWQWPGTPPGAVPPGLFPSAFGTELRFANIVGANISGPNAPITGGVGASGAGTPPTKVGRPGRSSPLLELCPSATSWAPLGPGTPPGATAATRATSPQSITRGAISRDPSSGRPSPAQTGRDSSG